MACSWATRCRRPPETEADDARGPHEEAGSATAYEIAHHFGETLTVSLGLESLLSFPIHQQVRTPLHNNRLVIAGVDEPRGTRTAIAPCVVRSTMPLTARLLGRLIAAQETERSRSVRDRHDGVSHQGMQRIA